jgi:hypothetical protein
VKKVSEPIYKEMHNSLLAKEQEKLKKILTAKIKEETKTLKDEEAKRRKDIENDRK